VPDPAPVTEPLSVRLRRIIGAWQPFTGHGVAAFAETRLTRVLALHLVAALAVAALTVWALRTTWFPVIHQALPRLPEAADLRAGFLSWPESQPLRLAQNPWLDLIVSPTPTTAATALGQTSDLQLELRPASFRFNGPFGHFSRPYPRSLQFDLGRIPATAAWSAWRLPISVLTGVGMACCLMLSWWILASVYSLPAWITAQILQRQSNLAASWRMAAASLLVGALVAATGLAAYAVGMMRLPGLLVSQALHVPIVWFWLLWGILCLPPKGRTPRNPGNPFRTRN
jgi:hypothetical protein